MEIQARAALGQYGKAEEAYEQAVRGGPDDAAAHAMLGALRFALHRHYDAEQAFEKAVSIEPALGLAHFGLALVYHELGDVASASEELRRLEWQDFELAGMLTGILIQLQYSQASDLELGQAVVALFLERL